MLRRRKGTVKGVVVMMAMQILVVVCVLLPWHQQQPPEEKAEWLIQQEVPERVGKYVILFKSSNSIPSIASTTDTSQIQGSLSEKPAGPITSGKMLVQSQKKEDSLEDFYDIRVVKEEHSEDNHQELLKSRLAGDTHEDYVFKYEESAKNDHSRRDKETVSEKEEEEDPEVAHSVIQYGKSAKHKEYSQEYRGTGWEEEEEEDPDVGRGFLDEYVTYRTDGNSYVLLGNELENPNANDRATQNENDVLWKNEDDDSRKNVEDLRKNVSGLRENENDDSKKNVEDLRKNVDDLRKNEDLRESEDNDLKENEDGNLRNNEDDDLRKSEADNLRKNEGTKRRTNGTDHDDKDLARYKISAFRPEQREKAKESQDYKFRSYDASNPFTLMVDDDTKTYFDYVGDATCFIDGTDIVGTQRRRGGICRCLEGYFGVDCGIPEAAWFDTYHNKYPNTQLKQRKVPRRVVNGLTVNHEFAMFEARMHELYDVVDVFIVAESNYTAHGDPKDFMFLERLRGGYLREFQDKMVYVSLNTFPSISQGSGWMADAYLRFYMGDKGLSLLKGLRGDDIFVLSDADEIPTREVITFLKMYDGYPEPVGFALQWNMFGFFWKMPAENTWTNWVKGAEEGVSAVTSVSTIGMLREVLFDNVFYIRKTGLWQYYKLKKKLKKYREKGHLVKEWIMGKVGHYAGWHCSWCFSPKNMVHKMNSAQADDEPRWGSMPEKKNLTYIASRISEGVWFNDEDTFLPVRDPYQKHYAPRYLLEHPTLYRSLLYHPGHPLNHNQPWAPP